MKDNIVGIVFLGLTIVCTAVYLVKFFCDRYGRVKTVKATVVHKQTVESFSKYAGNGTHTRYCVTFLIGGKRRSFYVSEFSYRGYKLNESGTLKYRGSRIIDFS
ncbi:MAG: DUF2500 family protein [Oscillospiraceae bacterium]|nr:DUF2500 family protein [Oscillospiraceae bacterium]MBQ9930033.1 DUF2500 family protein [Oscillospiraceae bacterium]